jgi:hypothetical protein
MENDWDSQIYTALTAFLNEIGLSESDAGYFYIIEAVTAVAKSFDLRMTAKEIYAAVAQKIEKSVGKVICIIGNSLDRLWVTGNQDILNGLFPDYRKASAVRPPNKQFLITLADYLTKEKMRIIDTDSFTQVLSGYILLALKEMKFSDDKLIEIVKRVGIKSKTFNCEEAEKTYKFFINEITPVMIDGMVVPRRCEDIRISDLRYSGTKIGYDIAMTLKSKNIVCIKDFQKQNIDNLRNVSGLEERHIYEFDDALVRTIIRGYFKANR